MSSFIKPTVGAEVLYWSNGTLPCFVNYPATISHVFSDNNKVCLEMKLDNGKTAFAYEVPILKHGNRLPHGYGAFATWPEPKKEQELLGEKVTVYIRGNLISAAGKVVATEGYTNTLDGITIGASGKHLVDVLVTDVNGDKHTVLDLFMFRNPDSFTKNLRCYVRPRDSQPEPNTKGVSFSLALNRLKNGEKMYRDGWGNPNIWIELQHAGPDSFMTEDYIFIVDGSGKTKRVPWIPTQKDLLASDWFIK